MKQLTQEEVDQLAPHLPVQRGNVKLSVLVVLNAMLYVVEQGCQWRALPERYGPWHSVYMRLNRWAKSGVLQRVFAEMQRQRLIRVTITAVSLDSTSVKVHPDAAGARKKTGPSPSDAPEEAAPPKFIWSPRMNERP